MGHNDSGLGEFTDKLDEESFKKLRKVMTQITQFYEGGWYLLSIHIPFDFGL